MRSAGLPHPVRRVPAAWGSRARGMQRYATMDFARPRRRSPDEICKFPVERRAVSRAAAGDVVAGRKDRSWPKRRSNYHDHTSAPRSGCGFQWSWRRCLTPNWSAPRSVVIWTTTPWTMPGNRAVAAGAEFDVCGGAGGQRWRMGRSRAHGEGEIVLVALGAAAGGYAERLRDRRPITVLRRGRGCGTGWDVVMCASVCAGCGYERDDVPLLHRGFRDHRGGHRVCAYRSGSWRG